MRAQSHAPDAMAATSLRGGVTPLPPRSTRVARTVARRAAARAQQKEIAVDKPLGFSVGGKGGENGVFVTFVNPVGNGAKAGIKNGDQVSGSACAKHHAKRRHGGEGALAVVHRARGAASEGSVCRLVALIDAARADSLASILSRAHACPLRSAGALHVVLLWRRDVAVSRRWILSLPRHRVICKQPLPLSPCPLIDASARTVCRVSAGAKTWASPRRPSATTAATTWTSSSTRVRPSRRPRASSPRRRASAKSSMIAKRRRPPTFAWTAASSTSRRCEGSWHKGGQFFLFSISRC